MKLNRTFIACLVVFLAIAVALQFQVPGRFDWNATWSPSDANPFGCEEFDSVLHASMPNGYRVEKASLWQYVQKKQQANLLYIYPSSYYDSTLINGIVTLAKRGNKILLVSDESYYERNNDQEILGIDMTGYHRFDINTIREELNLKRDVHDTIYWTGKPYPTRSYQILYQLLDEPTVLLDSKAKWDTLAYIKERDEDDTTMLKRVPLAVRRKFYKGELIVAANPLLFTNYGMLEGQTQGYIFRLMNYIADRQVVRLTDMSPTQAEQERQSTPLRAIFQSRQLTWAFYLTIFVLLLFFIFTARRRQRAIPVISAPRNHTLEFTKLIGTLFYQRHNRVDLLRRKWDLFAAEIRQTVDVDVQSLDDDDTLFSRLAERTGMDYEVIAKKIKNIRYFVMNEIDINDTEMKDAIDDMDEITEKSR